MSDGVLEHIHLLPGPSNPEHGTLQRFYFCVRSLCVLAGRWAVPGAKYKSSKCIVGLDLNPLSAAPAPDCWWWLVQSRVTQHWHRYNIDLHYILKWLLLVTSFFKLGCFHLFWGSWVTKLATVEILWASVSIKMLRQLVSTTNQPTLPEYCVFIRLLWCQKFWAPVQSTCWQWRMVGSRSRSHTYPLEFL